MVNTHGMVMTGLKKVTSESKKLYGSGYLQVNYKLTDGKVWSDYRCGFNEWWTNYEDANIVSFTVRDYIPMQTLADRIADRVEEYKRLKEWE